MEKKTRFLNCKKIIAPEEPNFYSVEFLNGEFNVLNLAPFAYILSIPVGIYICGSGSILGIRIRIHEAPENGSNTDPDQQQRVGCIPCGHLVGTACPVVVFLGLLHIGVSQVPDQPVIRGLNLGHQRTAAKESRTDSRGYSHRDPFGAWPASH